MIHRVRKGDMVQVTAGKDKGRTGQVLRVLHDKNRVVVQGINRVWKHVRPSQRHPQGGRIQKDASIHLSNVQPLDPGSNRPTRVRAAMKDGEKHRVSVRSKVDMGRVGRRGRKAAAGSPPQA